MTRKLILAVGLALASAPAQAQVGPSPVMARVDRAAMAKGQPAPVCLDISSSQCMPIGSIVGGAFQAAIGLTIALPSIAPLDTTYATTYASMGNAMRFGAGNQISYCPELSCLSTSPAHGNAPYNDHQRTSALISAQTQIDNQAEEQTLAINTLIGTGARTGWAAGTTYAVGANVLANGNIYRATVAGTSAASGSGPSGFGASGTQLQTDGTVTWKWINASSIATKLGLYMETAMEGGAGFSEGVTTNFQLLSAQYAPNGKAADPNQGAVGIEHDFYDGAADCAVGKCIGMSMAMSGPYQSWAAMNFDGGGGSHGGTRGAVAIAARFGNRLAQWADISIVDNAQIGLLIGNDSPYGGNSGPTAHGLASILDNASAPWSYIATGNYGNGGFVVNPATSTPLGFQCVGLVGNSCFNDSSSSQVAIAVGGTHNDGLDLSGIFNNYLINAQNFKVTPSGTVSAASYQEILTTPASSSATCTAGQFTDDANYHYVCVATNTWKRAALSAF